MPVIKSKVNVRAPDFAENAQHMQEQVDDLRSKLETIKQGGGEKSCARHVSRGKLLPRDRVAGLLDPGSPFLELSQMAGYEMYGKDVVNAGGVIAGIGQGARWYRTLFLEEAGQDYVRTARAKGLSEIAILFRHILPNALIPILTGVVVLIPILFMGSLVMESFFGIPGLGNYMLEAIRSQDFAIVRSMVFIGSILYIIGLKTEKSANLSKTASVTPRDFPEVSPLQAARGSQNI